MLNFNISLGNDRVYALADHIKTGMDLQHDAGNLIAVFSKMEKTPSLEVLADLRAILLTADEEKLSESMKTELNIIRGLCDRIIAANPGNIRFPNEILNRILSKKQLSEQTSLAPIANINEKCMKMDDLGVGHTARNAVNWILSQPYCHLLHYADFREYRDFDDTCLKILITRCPNLHTLRIQKSKITLEGIKMLAESRNLGSLQYLDLGANGINREGLKLLAESTAFPSLKGLNLWYNWYLNDQDAKIIATSKTFSSLIDLDISEIGITKEGIKAIVSSISTLQGLNLYGCSLGDAGVIEVLDVLKSTSMRKLRLGKNGIGQEGLKAIATSPKLAGLRTLALNENRMENIGLHEIATSKTLTSLRELNISDNRLQTRAAHSLANSQNLASLERLYVNNNGLSEGTREIASSSTLTNLTELEIGNNGVGYYDLGAIASSVNLASLRILYLSRNPLNDVGVELLANSTTLTSLRELYVSSEHTGVESVRALASSKGLISLRKVSIRNVPWDEKLPKNIKWL